MCRGLLGSHFFEKNQIGKLVNIVMLGVIQLHLTKEKYNVDFPLKQR